MSLKKDRNYYIHSAVSLLIMLLFRFLPAPEPITPMGMNILGIVIGAIYGWSTVDMVWPSIAALLLLGNSGYCSVKEAFALAVSNDTVLFVFFLLLFSGILNYSGIAKAIASRIISSKRAEGKPWMLSLLILLSAFIPSMAIGGIPIMLICWNILYQISAQVGYKKGDAWPALMTFGITMCATLGMCFFPFQISPVGMYGILSAIDKSMQVAYGPYIVFSIVFCALIMAGYLAIMKFFLRPDVSPLGSYRFIGEIEPLTYEQKVSLYGILAMIVLLTVPNLLPKTFLISKFLSGIGNTGIVAFIVGVCLLIRRDGRQVFPIKDVANEGVLWGMMFMFSAALLVSGALTSTKTGVSVFLAQNLSSLFSSQSPYTFAALILILVFLSTNVLSSPVVAMIAIPIAYTFAGKTGASMMAMMAPMVYLDNLAFMLPSGSPTAAIMYGNREWITANGIMKYSVIMIALVYIITLVVGIPLSNLLF